MKLWHLKRREAARYDEYDAVLVRAPSAREARGIAVEKTEECIWRDADKTSCSQILENGPAKALMTSYNAG